MRIEKFEDIIAWQKAKILTLRIYALLEHNRDFSYRDQIQRAAVSIMNNIAEGFERRGDVELRRFFFIAKGSCGEVRSLLHLGRDLHYFSESDFLYLHDLALETSKLLSAFIKKLG
ncbi:MAG: four helix bundle protein [Candidatus Taylorbacteria bacterium RIFCSPHIGHO2_01_FULL_51_15]|uniref:Four helix bundle protein n=1 Tax=Candidatus Taylorbacteria bacterium RIFCSPHIGHO2_01_FULL_51_15 TaxID=1802304 RepID=A0A1G2M947_9BACT|nr:MAG: four helix bundle protein [Candidatus Taylorbacteria bacterium RIFCSPHIGHO2_01_FULL_51_15]